MCKKECRGLYENRGSATWFDKNIKTLNKVRLEQPRFSFSNQAVFFFNEFTWRDTEDPDHMKPWGQSVLSRQQLEFGITCLVASVISHTSSFCFLAKLHSKKVFF